jgi:hypothetical protein
MADNKVIAFYYKKQMVFRLGKGFEPVEFGVKKYQFLQPFKTKAPMKGWFQIPYSENSKWGKLTILALNKMIRELDG